MEIRNVFFVLLLSFFGVFSTPSFAQTALNGAGSTFVFPILSQWGYAYNQKTGVKVNYQSIGSGGGIAQIKAKTVDFGATDAPLSQVELEASGLVQFPVIVGGVVLAINVPGITPGQLKLSPETLSAIYLGKITKWNDEAIKKDNPDLALPDKAVTVVYRADGSGTSWIFTKYLSAISAEWKEKVGADKAVSWPVGIGGKGNEGVSAYVQRVAGAIGYIEYAYAVQNKLTYTQLKNKNGDFVSPTMESFSAAAANAAWTQSPAYDVILVDQPGVQSWPITGATFVLLHKTQADKIKGKEMLKFFDWSYKNGAEMAKGLHYVALPQNVTDLVSAKWAESVKASDQVALWP